MISIGGLEHSDVGNDGVDLFVHHLEITGMPQREGPVRREGLGPGEARVEEVAWYVHVGVARPQCYHVSIFAIIKYVIIHQNRTIDHWQLYYILHL